MRRRKNSGAQQWCQKAHRDIGRQDPNRWSAQHSEEGSGTLLSIGVIVAILSACTAIAVLLGVHVTRVRAQNGADMAALAGADLSRTSLWVAVGNQPCQQAQEAAQRNDVHLGSCEVLGVDVRVEVSAEFGPWRVHARARAGPEIPEGASSTGAASSQRGPQPGPAGSGEP